MSIKKLTQILSLRHLSSLGACAFLLAGLAGFTSTAAAQSAPTLEAGQKKAVAVVLTQSKVVKDAQGREQLVDASAVKPGDIVEYRAVYTNNTGKPVTGLVANLPIPEGLEYQPRSAKPGANLVQAATKDAVFGPEPLVRKAAGNKTEPVPYAEYRSLRWTLGQLPANGSTAVSVRAKVETVVPVAPQVSAATPQAPPATAQR
ncbi:putative repeat protein (TIGR01451 family) [Variovorax boronicumulans]|uniref:hypothetical protein n=1 Tax=Variovorax boronicumulans TaxID=436515 RepID=UPI00247642D0|nr:hypothetical protein [Variovorax boronicumulans]MDH6169251.1 putative repeat protein (TIGR01451 family) [Variovorax boronicumulans]